MSKRTWFIVGIIFLVLLGSAVIYRVFFSSPDFPELKSEFYGMIKNVREENDKIYLTVDEVEFISGEEAITKGMKDTGCSRDDIYNCIPSLNNDFYIRNIDHVLTELKLSPAAAVKIFENPGSPVLKDSTPEEILAEFPKTSSFMSSFPFRLRSEAGEIISLEEQYIP